MLLLRVTNISANCDCKNICKSAKQAASLVYTKRAQGSTNVLLGVALSVSFAKQVERL